MKPKRNKTAKAALSARVPPLGRALRLFRWLAVLLVPSAWFLLELALRLAGVGYPTHFFVPAPGHSGDFYVANPKFGWRFFPQSVARVPEPIQLAKVKAAGAYRIFVFGESAALGDPEPAYSFSRILRELLEERCPGIRFEIINVGMTAISSQAVQSIARDCVPFQADLWIVYMGNNEVIGPFGPGSVFGAKAPPLPLIRANLAAKRSRAFQFLDSQWQRARRTPATRRQWEGMKMMVKEHVRASDPVLERVREHFRQNLEAILSAASRAQAKAILCSVASNLKDCPPFLSLHRMDLREKERARWTVLFDSATQLDRRGQVQQALAAYQQAADIDSTYSALLYRMAQCRLRLGDAAAARRQFIQARDLDALRFRADSALDEIIRNTSSRHAGSEVDYFDSEAAVVNEPEKGTDIPGAEYFWDHVHFNFKGNYRMARALAEHVLPLLPESLRPGKGTSGRILTEAECAERLAYTDWDRRAVLERMWLRVHEPPFTDQLDHAQLIERWSTLLADMEAKTDPAALAKAVEIYTNALHRRADDWMLHHHFAFLLEALGDLPGAERHWAKVIETAPGYADAWFKLGDMSYGQSKMQEAEERYRRVLHLRPTSFEALNGLGLVLMSDGKPQEAAGLFAQALHIEPKFPQAHVNLGLLLAQQGRTGEAELHYREALGCGPQESAGAHINLANLLAAQQKTTEAIEHYLKAIKLRPMEATVRLGLANCLESVGRGSEAVLQFQEAIRLNPALAEAHFNLGVAFAKRGDFPGASRSFQEAARLNPQDSQAFLSLGVALAQQHRLDEAIAQFQTVLRLDPANPVARRYLQTAATRQQPKP